VNGVGFTPSHRGGSGAPLVCLHGFTDTWRTWELILPALERRHEVLAPTLPGHAGGPPLPAEVTDETLVEAVERAMDEAGFADAHLVGNSLGGFVALQLAARGRGRAVVALAPAGGWAEGDPAFAETIGYFLSMQEMLKNAVEHADAIVASPEGRRIATEYFAVNYEHIPAELLAHMMRGGAACEVTPLIAHAERAGWNLGGGPIECPVRIVWGDADRILVPPGATVRFREEWVPGADWVELGEVGHCPQLDVPLETAELILGFTDPGGG
jgi:pimeloyl-ACP methyl ester carboxylesterase